MRQELPKEHQIPVNDTMELAIYFGSSTIIWFGLNHLTGWSPFGLITNYMISLQFMAWAGLIIEIKRQKNNKKAWQFYISSLL